MTGGWRVWFAFESRPGITMTSTQDRSEHWRALAEACRRPDGVIDAVEFNRWLDVLIDYTHLWATA